MAMNRQERLVALLMKPLAWFTDRFVVDEHGCWLWTSTLDNSGYGKVYGLNAHRVMYQRKHGPLASRVELDHLCRVRRCVNPSHLEPVTTKENCHRGNGQGGLNKRKTHCKRGHALDAPDVYHMKGKGRTCNACRRLLRSGTK